MYESKMRDALVWPTHGQPLMLRAHAQGCQNQYVGISSVFPSGPICAVMPCISLGWNTSPPSLGSSHKPTSLLLGVGPPRVSSEPVVAHTSPRYAEMRVGGDRVRMVLYTRAHSSVAFVPLGRSLVPSLKKRARVCVCRAM